MEYNEIQKIVVFFFFQAEDGIRDHCVTGVQTCALPICIYLYIYIYMSGCLLNVHTTADFDDGNIVKFEFISPRK